MSLSGALILLVEDDSDTRDMYDFALCSLGAEVVTAETASEGLEAFRRVRPDVLVSDITLLEDGDGYALMRAIRALAPHEGGTVPAVALSGWAEKQAGEAAREAGFDEHCPKPCTPVELAAVIAGLLLEEYRASSATAKRSCEEPREAPLQSEAHRGQTRKGRGEGESEQQS